MSQIILSLLLLLFATLGFSQTDTKGGRPQKSRLENNSLKSTGPGIKPPSESPERKRVQPSPGANEKGTDKSRQEKPEKNRAFKAAGKVGDSK